RRAPAGATVLMRFLLILGLAASMLGGCSFKQTVVNYAGDAISGGGGVWSSDEDPQLIKEALPFALKTNESLLEVSPDHEGLLEATATGFLAYALLVKEEADRVEVYDRMAARRQKIRASKLFVRGHDYALRALEQRYPGFTAGLKTDRDATLARTTALDASFLYLAGAGLAGALSADTANLALVASLPIAGAMVQRVLTVDEAFNEGSAHEFMVSFEASRPIGSIEAARSHYDRALELSGGARASVFLALAEAVSVGEQDVNEFRAMLKTARAVDIDEKPNSRLIGIACKTER
ncbi:MAG: TRAP transporter TatT component family protein, partial [Alphaproteobacteria bacterium]